MDDDDWRRRSSSCRKSDISRRTSASCACSWVAVRRSSSYNWHNDNVSSRKHSKSSNSVKVPPSNCPGLKYLRCNEEVNYHYYLLIYILLYDELQSYITDWRNSHVMSTKIKWGTSYRQWKVTARSYGNIELFDRVWHFHDLATITF